MSASEPGRVLDTGRPDAPPSLQRRCNGDTWQSPGVRHGVGMIRLRLTYVLEMCMGMGFPVATGIPWDYRGNGNEKQICTGNGNGIDFRGSENFWKMLC